MPGDNVTLSAGAQNVNLNQSADTVLLTVVATKPMLLQRFGVIGDSANGLLAAMRLKLRKVPIATGTAADIDNTTLNPGSARARGVGVYKDMEAEERINAGDKVTVAVATSAGGTSTGDVFLEWQTLPFAGDEIDDWVASS